MEKILVVDDDQSILTLMKMRLEVEGYEVTTSQSPQQALEVARESVFDMALLDYRLGEMSGVALMEDLLGINPDMPVIILTAYGSIEGAVEAMKRGAYGYLTKPFDFEGLLLQIRHCSEKSRLSKEVQRLKSLVDERYGFENIIGNSEAMKKVLAQVYQASQVDSSVYISGESGTGKELIAKSLHLASHRKDGPFVAINCAAIPETLLESELFGHEKGAFTGAQSSRKGLFAQANRGTFFLDEVSEMPLSMQAKLLRALGEMAFYPLGGNKMVKVDTRIIAASNKDLETEVAKGRFREDLFYRIHVVPIRIPPLRERKEDIPLLARHFLKKKLQKAGKTIVDFSPEALRKLMLHSWPGNVRELENSIESAVAMATSTRITEDLVLPGRGADPEKIKSFKDAKDEFERQYLIQLIGMTEGNVSLAAKLAGKYRSDLYELLRKYDLDPESFRKPPASAEDV
ncbi:MAG: sigma-54-dependent Fis family transcriptional regulator [Desulfobacteraceae bacterium]|nr:MAG: sigma-54-dependent Fis family transcriptional regulator [Desulfobacteraceae bacterium]